MKVFICWSGERSKRTVNTYKLKDNINPEQIETMWTVIQQQVNGAKQVMVMEGKPFPPESL